MARLQEGIRRNAKPAPGCQHGDYHHLSSAFLQISDSSNEMLMGFNVCVYDS